MWSTQATACLLMARRRPGAWLTGVSGKLGSGRVFVVKLRPLPHCTDPVKALRSALKVLLRRFGLRCIEAHEAADKEDADD